MRAEVAGSRSGFEVPGDSSMEAFGSSDDMNSCGQKRIGRPPTGGSPAVAVRLDGDELKRVDRFAQAHGISRSQALRRLIHRGLSRAAPAEEGIQRPRPQRRRGLAK